MTLPGGSEAAQPAYPFDARPLVEPVDSAAVRAFTQQQRMAGGLPSGFTGSSVVGIVVFGVATVMFASVFLTVAFTVIDGGLGGLGLLVGLMPLLVIGLVATAVAIAFVAGTRVAAHRMYRLDRFARANGMSYLPALGTHSLPGLIFGVGNGRMATDVLRGEQPRFVEFANYEYSTGSGKSRTTHKWGYVAVKLDVPLPHIVLDATGNNGLFGSNLPAAFDKDQRLGLEGDFDRYFSLYCPEGYEADALYLFTPDIMARFIDNVAALDVEIVDDWLLLYAKREFSGLDPATWAWLFSVVGALLDKFAQWARWRDDRLRAEAAAEADASALAGAGPGIAAGGAASAMPFQAPLDALRPPPGVALQGRRLQRGVPWVSFIVVGAIALYWLLSQTGILALFFR
ncbi:hypothetical protein [Microbacterium sp. CFBP9034]|uniref:hypothetical protein n=1 Tax=Microbacterium sp. CFBP9034 TaxID=3096540 RepID=UPI002A6B095C|nr:hypothetical protein [Microbacterium sp. CFBP9034]MDY0908120.1 hypothetical protein [Microbacterium sp. CFBP9034]